MLKICKEDRSCGECHLLRTVKTDYGKVVFCRVDGIPPIFCEDEISATPEWGKAVNCEFYTLDK